MVMSTSRPSRLPLEQFVPTATQNETVAGEFWIIKRDGEDWPVVISDEEIVRTFFKGRVRPFNARQADGTWPDDYKTGGTRAGLRCYPAVQLGLLRFTWISWKALEEFDLEMGQAIQASTSNKKLAQGWSEAMRLYELEDPLPELKRVIRQDRLEKAKPKSSAMSDGVEKLKRKGTPLFKDPPFPRVPPPLPRVLPPFPRVEDVDDEEPGDLIIQQGGIIRQPIKKEPGDSASFADMSVFERSTDLTRSDSEQPNKKSRLDTLGRSSMRPSTPLRPTPRDLSSRHMSLSRAAPASSLEKIIDDPNKVTIFVGNPHTLFGIRRSGLDASPLLSSWLSYHPGTGWCVMSPTLAELDKNDFLPIGEYLQRGEYDPNIVDEGTEWVRLETTIGVQEDVSEETIRSEEVIRSGVIYNTARTLELPGLQDLAFRKLKVLAKNEPHQPFAILEVVDHVFKAAEPDMKNYLVEYLAEHFWNFVMAENKKFTDVMEADEVLAKRVFGLRAGVSEAEVKDKEAEKIKVEKLLGEDKDDPLSPATLVGDEADDSFIGKDTSLELILDYNGPIGALTNDEESHPCLRKMRENVAKKDRASKDKAERDRAVRLTAKEFLADNDAFVDNATRIIAAADGTVIFGGPDYTTRKKKVAKGMTDKELLESIEAAKREWEEEDREEAERVRAVRKPAKEFLADNDASVDNAASIIAAANGTVSFGGPDHATTSTLANKEKAKRDRAVKMTAKEFLADNDASVDNAASIIAAANGTVSFGEPDPAMTATPATKEKAKKMTAKELLADDDGLVHNVASVLSATANGNVSRPNHGPPTAADVKGLSQEFLDLIEEVEKDEEREDEEKAVKEMLETVTQMDGVRGKGVDLDGMNL